MLAFGLAWLARVEGAARRAGEGFGELSTLGGNVTESPLRDRASLASEFDPAELIHGSHTAAPPAVFVALLPLVVVIFVNLVMSVVVLPGLDTSFLAEEKMGRHHACRGRRCLGGRGRAAGHRDLDRPQFPAGSLERQQHGRGRDRIGAAGLERGEPGRFRRGDRGAARLCHGARLRVVDRRDLLVSLAVATNILAALTGSASGGLTIALDALGETY